MVDQTPVINERIQAVSNEKNFGPLLKKLLLTAESNALKLPQQRRCEAITNKFSTSLFIFSCPIAYDFLHRNMPEAIPSLRTVQRVVAQEYHTLHEGVFRFDKLLSHLDSYNASKVITIGEDATRLVSRVEYDKEKDRLVGFVLPSDDKGIPLTDSIMAVSFHRKLLQSWEDCKLCFCVYMAQSLCPDVPAFCLACMGTDNKFTADLILKQWKYIFLECNKRGISVVSFGADGDSRELSAMQNLPH